MPARLTRKEAEQHPTVEEAVSRGLVEFKKSRVYYSLYRRVSYDWSNPEEWARCVTFARLVLEKDYPPDRIAMEVSVPRRTPSDAADIVVYRDDGRKEPYLVVENKAAGQTDENRKQGIEQLFGNANSLRAPLGLYDEYSRTVLFDVENFPSMEREKNRKGNIDAVPEQYGDVPTYTYIAGSGTDISPARPGLLESKIRRAHSIIWSGGKRDPLTSFDEWSKLLFAKVHDERHTPNDEPRRFQIGTNETTAKVANEIHALFRRAIRKDPTVFPEDTKIDLPDSKIVQIVSVLEDLSISATDVDTIGTAFETFFGSVFRGELGQYFTMRPIARFSVAMLDLDHEDFVIDPTAGSGGFLLEALLQVWHRIERDFRGQDVVRLKTDFAYIRVYGIEIHPVLARICKINMILHHDGHTHIEGDRSCLDSEFNLDKLKSYRGAFDVVVGNPPFGDLVRKGDEDKLGHSALDDFETANDRTQVPSEHVILERSVEFLNETGAFGLVVPDGLLNNQGEQSNCPHVRRWLARNGAFLGIVSLPDHAFRRSGAQNKTSILFYRKFSRQEKREFDAACAEALEDGRAESEDDAILYGLETLDYKVFLAEANHIGYTPTGASSLRNDLYRGGAGGQLDNDQSGTILGEFQKFKANPDAYEGGTSPDTGMMNASELWAAHESHRLDPKYHLFKREEQIITPAGWERLPLKDVMRRREIRVKPEERPEEPVTVMTLQQTGDIRPRPAGKGRNPPEWLGMYFEDSSSKWYAARSGDVVFSSIDLWKGCIAVVPEDFDRALVTREFPIYEITDDRLDPQFLSCLLRSRYYQRAFRAITTGHSNRRRTQTSDFEELEIVFPPDRDVQQKLIEDVLEARRTQREASTLLKEAMIRLSDIIDRRGEEEYEVDDEEDDDDEYEDGEE